MGLTFRDSPVFWCRSGQAAQLAFAQSTSCLADRVFQLQSLQSENTSLRRQVPTNTYHTPGTSDRPDPSSPSALKRRQSARASRPMSMYETGSGLKPYHPKGESPFPEEAPPTLQPFPPHVSKTCSPLSPPAISCPRPRIRSSPCLPNSLPAILHVFLPRSPLRSCRFCFNWRFPSHFILSTNISNNSIVLCYWCFTGLLVVNWSRCCCSFGFFFVFLFCFVFLTAVHPVFYVDDALKLPIQTPRVFCSAWWIHILGQFVYHFFFYSVEHCGARFLPSFDEHRHPPPPVFWFSSPG